MKPETFDRVPSNICGLATSVLSPPSAIASLSILLFAKAWS